jgi:hypothetical protein
MRDNGFPMNLLIFLATLSVSVLAFELMTSFRRVFTNFGKGLRLDGVQLTPQTSTALKRLSIPAVLLIGIATTRFEPQSVTNTIKVIS